MAKEITITISSSRLLFLISPRRLLRLNASLLSTDLDCQDEIKSTRRKPDKSFLVWLWCFFFCSWFSKGSVHVSKRLHAVFECQGTEIEVLTSIFLKYKFNTNPSIKLFEDGGRESEKEKKRESLEQSKYFKKENALSLKYQRANSYLLWLQENLETEL